jgi:hypothetical protein
MPRAQASHSAGEGGPWRPNLLLTSGIETEEGVRSNGERGSLPAGNRERRSEPERPVIGLDAILDLESGLWKRG